MPASGGRRIARRTEVGPQPLWAAKVKASLSVFSWNQTHVGWGGSMEDSLLMNVTVMGVAFPKQK